ncbi:hypothetical protein C8J56DRAFT_794030 [Mycena floridula]|nr:hypothetical protein C8J56DRAFT_794030 [Mycena floridula]
MSSPSYSDHASFLSLPSEVLELILICASSSPASIAHVSQCCHSLYSLLLTKRNVDAHLWREIFLTTFDDPRPIQEIRRRPFDDAAVETVPFEWQAEFIRRCRTKKFFKRYSNDTETSVIEVGSRLDLMTKSELFLQTSLLECFEGVLSTLLTAAPLQFQPATTFITAPTFPPLVVRYSAQRTPVVSDSKNILWLNEVFELGYPRFLTALLIGTGSPDKPKSKRRKSHKESELDKQFSHVFFKNWAKTEEGRVFYKTVFLTGFRPSPSLSESAPPRYKLRSSGLGREGLSLEGQSILARTTSRSIVYDMSFPNPVRCWGPFLSIEADEEPLNETGDPESDDADEKVEPALSVQQVRALLKTHPTYIFPKYPHRLVPDYRFLAAARNVVEENLRNRLTDVTADWTSGLLMDAMKSLDIIRMGSAPGFWDKTGWSQEADIDEEATKQVAKSSDQPQKDKQNHWDWAGVEGEWKRVVCWQDYRSLLFHNLRAFDTSTEMHEIMRVFPMRLRVASYTDAPKPPPSGDSKGKGKADADSHLENEHHYEDPATSLCYHLPIINVEGEAWGSDTDQNSPRKVKGTVRMIGDGAIRWSLVSEIINTTSDPQWVTECIQVGTIGSAIGFVGLWTGATHQRSDPIGSPTWAWKVGVAK